ncbi:MAG: hypothetical protein ABI585_12060 [Betaproteobacteria bacterium]
MPTPTTTPFTTIALGLPAPVAAPYTVEAFVFPAQNGTPVGAGIRALGTCAIDGSGTLSIQAISANASVPVPLLPLGGGLAAMSALLAIAGAFATRRRRR